MKIFQNIPISSTNPFLPNRIVNHIRYTTPIVVPYGYSNYSAPSFPTIVANQSFFHPQTYSYPFPFPILNSNPPIANYHSNNHFGQFYSSPIPQNFYSTPHILHYPTFHQIPTILTSCPANQTLLARMSYEYYPQPIASTNHLKKFSEIGTQTEPQDFIDIRNYKTQIDYSQGALKPKTSDSRRGILRSTAQNLERNGIESDELQPNSKGQIKSELPPLPILAKTLRALNGDHEIGLVDCNVTQLSNVPQEMRYC